MICHTLSNFSIEKFLGKLRISFILSCVRYTEHKHLWITRQARWRVEETRKGIGATIAKFVQKIDVIFQQNLSEPTIFSVVWSLVDKYNSILACHSYIKMTGIESSLSRKTADNQFLDYWIRFFSRSKNAGNFAIEWKLVLSEMGDRNTGWDNMWCDERLMMKSRGPVVSCS